MSKFEVLVTRLSDVVPHPNADKLEIAKVCGFSCIVLKDKFKKGDLVAYIPEQAVLPESLIEEMGLTGRLAGSKKNRVKAVRLRGVLSQGLVLEAKSGWKEGDDVAAVLGIVKYKEPIPPNMGGDVWFAGSERTLKYDIENWQKHKRVFKEGEPVVFTEKCHGTFSCFSFNHSPHPEEGTEAIFSKGRGEKGLALRQFKKPVDFSFRSFIRNEKKNNLNSYIGCLIIFAALISLFIGITSQIASLILLGFLFVGCLKPEKVDKIAAYPTFGFEFLCAKLQHKFSSKKDDGLANKKSCYIQVFRRLRDKLKRFEISELFSEEKPYFVLGEIFGSGIQDLTYGHHGGNSIDFRIFDIYVGKPGIGRFLNDAELDVACKLMAIPRVPVLYRGPFSKQEMKKHAKGPETISGKSCHIREGIVIRPQIEREDQKIGRCQLKFINEAYLERKKGTERN